jgi:hypothetical protein
MNLSLVRASQSKSNTRDCDELMQRGLDFNREGVFRGHRLLTVSAREIKESLTWRPDG